MATILLKDQRLPDETVLKDQFGRPALSADERKKAATYILQPNVVILGIVTCIKGSDYVGSIEQVLKDLSSEWLTEACRGRSARLMTYNRWVYKPTGLVKQCQSTRSLIVRLCISIFSVPIDSSATPEQIDQIFAKHVIGSFMHESG